MPRIPTSESFKMLLFNTVGNLVTSDFAERVASKIFTSFFTDKNVCATVSQISYNMQPAYSFIFLKMNSGMDVRIFMIHNQKNGVYLTDLPLFIAL